MYIVFYSNLEGGMCDALLWLRNSVVGRNNDNLMLGGGGGGSAKKKKKKEILKFL